MERAIKITTGIISIAPMAIFIGLGILSVMPASAQIKFNQFAADLIIRICLFSLVVMLCKIIFFLRADVEYKGYLIVLLLFGNFLLLPFLWYIACYEEYPTFSRLKKFEAFCADNRVRLVLLTSSIIPLIALIAKTFSFNIIIHLFANISGFILIACIVLFIINAYTNPKVERKGLWTVAIIIGSFISVPVYAYKFLKK